MSNGTCHRTTSAAGSPCLWLKQRGVKFLHSCAKRLYGSRMGSSKATLLEKRQRGVYVRSVRLMEGQTAKRRPGAQKLLAFGYEAIAFYAQCTESAVQHAVMAKRLNVASFASIFKFATTMRRRAPKEST